MNRRTQAIVGATVIAIGLGVYALGFVAGESSVRFVDDLAADPTAHTTGTYTLIGMLQPPTLPAPGGGTQANPEWRDATVHVERAIAEDGREVLRTHILLAARGDDGRIHWNLTTETRPADRAGAVPDVQTHAWSTPGGVLMQAQSFESGQSMWAVFHGAVGELLRKPSQFTGRLAADVPPGALVFEVDQLTMQCSSKFLPPDVAAEFDPDGTGMTQ